MAARVQLLLAAVPLGAVASTIFSCETPTATLLVDSTLTYSYAVRNQTWLEDGDFAAHYDGGYYTASSGALKPGTPRPGAGSDGFGAFSSLSVDWTAAALPYAFTTVFKCYAEATAPLAPLVAFSTVFPGGASGAIGTAAEDDPAGAPNGYNSSAAPIVVSEPWASSEGGGAWLHAEEAGRPSVRCSTSPRGPPTPRRSSTAARSRTSSGRGACVRRGQWAGAHPQDTTNKALLLPPPPRRVFSWININKGQCLLPQAGPPPDDGSGTGFIGARARGGAHAPVHPLSSGFSPLRAGGQIGGPVVLHEDSWPRVGGSGSAKPAAALALPLESFKHAILALHPGDRPMRRRGGGAADPLRWVFGPQGHLATLPPGFSVTLGLFASAAGITDVVYAGGAALQVRM